MMIEATTIRGSDNAFHPAYKDNGAVHPFPALVNDKGYFYEEIALSLAEKKLSLWAHKGPSSVGLFLLS